MKSLIRTNLQGERQLKKLPVGSDFLKQVLADFCQRCVASLRPGGYRELLNPGSTFLDPNVEIYIPGDRGMHSCVLRLYLRDEVLNSVIKLE